MENGLCPFCGQKTKMEHDVGYDISVEGEENQYVEYCICGAGRFVSVLVSFDGEMKTYYGQWKEKFGPIYF